MENKYTSIRQIKGTRVKKGNRLPRNFGRVGYVVFFPNEKRVAGFVTNRSTFLVLFRRKSHFISINGYYPSDDKLFVRRKKKSLDNSAYKALGLELEDMVHWLGAPVVAENGEEVGSIIDVIFQHSTGNVHSIVVSPGAVSKLVQSSRTIPADLIVSFDEKGTALSPAESREGEEDEDGNEASEASVGYPSNAIIVANEALDIEIKNAVAKTASKAARNAGLNTEAVSEKAKSAAETAGALANAGAVATAKQIKKTEGMFSAFKDEYNKARHGEQEDED